MADGTWELNLPRLADSPSSGDRPLYVQVKDVLLSNLADGTWKPGEQLPTETEISRHMGVSEGTVRQAVLALVKDGRIHRRSGKGTFVSRMRFDQSFTRFFRFKGSSEEEPFQYHVGVIDARLQRTVEPEIGRLLELDAGEAVLVLHRTISVDDVVVCHYRSYLAESRFPGLLSLPLEDVGLYDMLELHYGAHVVDARETLQARIANADDARILDIGESDAVIAIRRIAYTYRNQVLEVRNTVGRSDNFRYDIRLG